MISGVSGARRKKLGRTPNRSSTRFSRSDVAFPTDSPAFEDMRDFRTSLGLYDDRSPLLPVIRISFPFSSYEYVRSERPWLGFGSLPPARARPGGWSESTECIRIG